MVFLRIDAEKCRRDGLCAAACPLGLVRVAGEGPDAGLPTVREDMGDHCIGCGHCVAACPAGALSLAAFGPDRFEPIDRAALPTAHQVDTLLRSRRSVRAYKSESLPPETLLEIMDASRWAPSGHNAQPVEWSVARNRAGVVRVVDAVADWMRWACDRQRELARDLFLPGLVRAWSRGRDIIARGAPHLAVAHVPRRGITPEADAVVAAAWVEIAAHSRGVGACWCGYAMMARGHDAVNRALGIPEDRIMAAALLLGRPRFRYSSIPPRKDISVQWI